MMKVTAIDKFIKNLNGLISVEKKGRGEIINFHTYKIYKSGRVTTTQDNPVKPIIENGIAYLEIILDDKGKRKKKLELGKIVYSALVERIDLLSDDIKVIYLDGNGANFRLENLALQTDDFDDKDIELPKLKEITDKNTENCDKDIKSIIDSEETRTNERLIQEINTKVSTLIDNNFTQKINENIVSLKDDINYQRDMREADKIAFDDRLNENKVQLQQLEDSIIEKDRKINSLIEQNNTLLAERTEIEESYVILTKQSFHNMYNSMNKMLDMIDEINKKEN